MRALSRSLWGLSSRSVSRLPHWCGTACLQAVRKREKTPNEAPLFTLSSEVIRNTANKWAVPHSGSSPLPQSQVPSMNRQHVQISKFLSYVLRHRPESVGLELDENGWVDVDELLEAARRNGRTISRVELERVVADNDKQRFSLDAQTNRIRARQGHSVEVDLNLQPVQPPELLYHGTVGRFLDAIREQGLLPGDRRQVHLSVDEPTARRVGERRGRPVILVVESGRMHSDGRSFYLSENGVWLTDFAPPEYLRFPGHAG